MARQCFEDVDGRAFVGHVGQKGTASTVTACAFKADLFVQAMEELTERI